MLIMELKDYVERSFGALEKSLESGNEYIPTLEIAVTERDGNKSGVAVALMIDSKENIRKLIGSLGVVLGGIFDVGVIKSVDAIVMTSEGYFLAQDGKPVDIQGSIKDHPDRKEMIIACGMQQDGKTCFKGKEIFTVMVKGKRHYSFVENKMLEKAGFEKVQANILAEFFNGYNFSIDIHQKSPIENMLLERVKNNPRAKEVSFHECLEVGLQSIQKKLGGKVDVKGPEDKNFRNLI